MSTLAVRPVRIDSDPRAVGVELSDDVLLVVLSDGRELSAPIAWFPRLRDATAVQRSRWRLIGDGHGIHWPEVDEDVSVRALLDSRPDQVMWALPP